jgi:hypothetical protein
MSASIRLAFLLIALPFLAVAVPRVTTWLAAAGGPDEGQPAGATTREGPADEVERGARLEAHRDNLLKRLPATEAIVRALAERRLSVREAAQRVAALHDDDPRFWQVLSLHAGRDKTDRLSRRLIRLAVRGLEPERARALQRSLEAELTGAPAPPATSAP